MWVERCPCWIWMMLMSCRRQDLPWMVLSLVVVGAALRALHGQSPVLDPTSRYDGKFRLEPFCSLIGSLIPSSRPSEME